MNHLGASIKNDSVSIGGSPRVQNYRDNILLLLKGKPTEGKLYTINNTDCFGKYITDSTCLGITFTIFQFDAISGNIQLTKLDTLKKIVSGVFNCIIPVPNCDTLKITEGRFDIQYH